MKPSRRSRLCGRGGGPTCTNKRARFSMNSASLTHGGRCSLCPCEWKQRVAHHNLKSWLRCEKSVRAACAFGHMQAQRAMAPHFESSPARYTLCAACVMSIVADGLRLVQAGDCPSHLSGNRSSRCKAFDASTDLGNPEQSVIHGLSITSKVLGDSWSTGSRWMGIVELDRSWLYLAETLVRRGTGEHIDGGRGPLLHVLEYCSRFWPVEVAPPSKKRHARHNWSRYLVVYTTTGTRTKKLVATPALRVL